MIAQQSQVQQLSREQTTWQKTASEVAEAIPVTDPHPETIPDHLVEARDAVQSFTTTYTISKTASTCYTSTD